MEKSFTKEDIRNKILESYPGWIVENIEIEDDLVLFDLVDKKNKEEFFRESFYSKIETLFKVPNKENNTPGEDSNICIMDELPSLSKSIKENINNSLGEDSKQ